jgi:ElaB/YqjD/DUF883 family membrane-anchored ribosome-binding protein
MAETNYNSSVRESGRDLSSMADNAADMAAEVGGRVTDAASRAQQKVVDYFRNHDTSDMLEDLNGYVKSHPTQALLAAAALGFVAAACYVAGEARHARDRSIHRSRLVRHRR